MIVQILQKSFSETFEFHLHQENIKTLWLLINKLLIACGKADSC